MPFAAPTQRVILAQRETGKFVRQQDPPQIGMSFENDSVHVVDFAFHPVGPSHSETAEATLNRLVQKQRTINRSPEVVFARHKPAEPIFGVAIMQVVDAGNVDQHVESAIGLEEFEIRRELFRRNDDPPIRDLTFSENVQAASPKRALS